MTKQEILARLKGGLIVSCQAEQEKGSEFWLGYHIALMAKEVLAAGADAVRICGTQNIEAVRDVNRNAIIIGITKDQYPDGSVLITPSMRDVGRIVAAGADIVAMDVTKRRRPSTGMLAVETLTHARYFHPNTLFMADISDVHEADAAIARGADLVATTLSGYTPYTASDLVRDPWYEYWPDWKLIRELAKRHPGFPSIAEGRWRTPGDCWRAIHKHGAFAVCAGSQITRPREIVRWHVQAIKHGGFHDQ